MWNCLPGKSRRQEWHARYDFNDNFSPSNVVINALRGSITNYF
jgi:hypothetical protein